MGTMPETSAISGGPIQRVITVDSDGTETSGGGSSSLTYNSTPPTLTNGQSTGLQGDQNGRLLVSAAPSANTTDSITAYPLNVVTGSLTAGALNADLVPSTDMLRYSSFSLAVSGTFSGTLSFQFSDTSDFSSITESCAVMRITGGTSSASATATSTGIYYGVVKARYLRVRMTAYSSGTAAGSLNAFTDSRDFQTLGVSAGQSGTWSTTPQPLATSTGLTPYFNSSVSTTVQAVKASSGRLHFTSVYNPNASVAFLQLFNVASGSVTLGTTTPTLSIPIEASSALTFDQDFSMNWSTALSIAATTTATGNTALGTGLVVNMGYI